MLEAPGPTALLAFPGLLAHSPFLAGVRGQGQLALRSASRSTFGKHGLGLLPQTTFVLGGAIHVLLLPLLHLSANHAGTYS